MAAGSYQAFPISFVVPNLAANIPGVFQDNIDERVGLLSENYHIVGSHGDNQPITIRERIHSGIRNQYSFFDDFYFRMYFIPRIVDFGAVASDTSKSLFVWNTYFSNVDLDTITVANGEGIALALPGALPITFGPLDLIEFVFTASTSGPPDIDADYDFTFDNADSFTLPVVGARARLWKYPMNWNNPFEVTVSFKTEIITSRSRREQRIALRATPRKELAMTVHATGEKRRRLDKDMAYWNGRPFVVAEWSRYTTTAEPISAFETAVDMDTIPSWLVVDQKVMLVYRDQYEVRQVESIASNTVTFGTATALEWPEGTKVYKALDAQIDGQISSNRRTNTVATFPVKFDVTPVSEIPDGIGTPEVVFEDREVFIKKWNWAESVNIQYDHTREMIDFGRGKTAGYFPANFNFRTIKATWVGKNNQQADDLLRFFLRMRGQQGEFYRPTYEPDLTPKIAQAATSTFLRFDTLELFDLYSEQSVYQAVYLRMEDGSEQYNSIKEWGTISDGLGNDTLVEFNNPWAFDVDPANIVMLCWMPVWRFASDSVTFTWLTDSVCNVAMSFRLVENLVAELEPV